jgi:hypothetical protein
MTDGGELLSKVTRARAKVQESYGLVVGGGELGGGVGHRGSFGMTSADDEEERGGRERKSKKRRAEGGNDVYSSSQ